MENGKWEMENFNDNDNYCVIELAPQGRHNIGGGVNPREGSPTPTPFPLTRLPVAFPDREGDAQGYNQSVRATQNRRGR